MSAWLSRFCIGALHLWGCVFVFFFCFSQRFSVDSGIVLPVHLFVCNCMFLAGFRWLFLPSCYGNNSCDPDAWNLVLRIYLSYSTLVIFIFIVFAVLMYWAWNFSFPPSVQKCIIHFALFVKLMFIDNKLEILSLLIIIYSVIQILNDI